MTAPTPPTPPTPPRPPKAPLFVRLPLEEARRLDEAARRLQTAKSRLVSDLVSRYLPSSAEAPTAGIDALKGAPVGRHSFVATEQREVLTPEDLAELLALDLEVVLDLAEAGTLPGRKLGEEWRFSRQAILEWLAGGE